MYYVIYTGSGNESRTELYIKKEIPAQYCQSCFYPQRHMKKKIRGKWTDYYERLIPGYLFVQTDDAEGFYHELKKYPLILKMLGQLDSREAKEGEIFLPLSPRDERWLAGITGLPQKNVAAGGSEVHPIVELSEVGFDENDEVVILSGPLTDLKGRVKKIDLHRRIASVEVEFMGVKTDLHLGIELVGKTK